MFLFCIFFVLDIVVSCTWYNGSLKCLPKEGYGASQTVSEKFVVTIHKMPASGSYLCEISGPPSDEASLCSLTQEGHEVSIRQSVHFFLHLGSALISHKRKGPMKGTPSKTKKTPHLVDHAIPTTYVYAQTLTRRYMMQVRKAFTPDTTLGHVTT